MKTHYLIGAFLMLCSALVTAQDMFTVARYGTYDGMPHNLAQCYAQDSRGFIWTGTRNGLSRFDGLTFHNYKTSPSDEVRMSNNRIKYVWTSSTDKIWIQTFDYLFYLLDPLTGRFYEPVTDAKTTSRTKIYTLADGITYVLMDYRRLYRFDEHAPTFPSSGYRPLCLEAAGGSFYSVYRDSRGREWIMGSQGLGLLEADTVCPITTMVYDRMWEADGLLLLASKRGELAKLTVGDETDTAGDETVRTSGGEMLVGGDLVRISTLAHCPPDFTEIFPLDEHTFLLKTKAGVWLYRLDNGQLGRTEQLWAGPTPRDKELLLASDGTFWAFNVQGDIVRRDPYTRESRTLPVPRATRPEGEKSVRFLHEDRQGHIWALTDDGLLCHYDDKRQCLEPATWHQGGKVHQYIERVRYFFADRDRNLWLSTAEGMDLVAFRSQEFEWVGTLSEQDRSEIQANRQNVRCVFEDGHCNLWLCMQDRRVEIYDRNDRYLGNLAPDGRLVANHHLSFGVRVYSMTLDNAGNIWMGTREDGVYVLRQAAPGRYSIRRYRHDEADPYSVAGNSVFALCPDAEGRMWIGTFGQGICLAVPDGSGGWRFVHRGNDLKGYPQAGYHRVRCLAEAVDGTMMVGTTDGLVTFHATAGNDLASVTFYLNSVTMGRTDCLNSNDISHIVQDRRGRVYLSTMDGGISVAAPGTNLLSDSIALRCYSQQSGLMTDVVIATMEDLNGRIWVATPNAFSRWDVDSGTLSHIKPDFLRSQITLTEAAPIIDHDGNFVFGTTNGALRLLADRMRLSTLTPPLVIDEVRVHDKTTSTKQHNGGTVEIGRGERNLTVSFIALDYSDPTEINYAYRLLDNSDRWIELGHNRQVSFSNIPPGKHVLEVKSTNGDGLWRDNATRLVLNVIPTFWETGYATALYVVLAVAIILLSVYIILRISNLRREVTFEHRLTEVKLKFFTDISHELRTPLTLIAGPIEEVLAKENLTDSARDVMLTAQRNTDRMLKLVNQILDFKKVQAGRMKVRVEPTDVVALAHKVYLSFTAMAAQRDIRFTYDTDVPHLVVYTDAEKVEKILFNLLSNAFKYTPDHKAISLRTLQGEGCLRLEVVDEGKGFDSREASRLYLRFETGSDADPHVSSGIGLALTKELVRILHGRLEATGTKGEGSTFTVELPTDLSVYAGDSQVTIAMADSATASGSAEGELTVVADDVSPDNEGMEAEAGSGKPRLLVIDDNAELRRFVRHILGADYDLYEASDGREGLELSRELNPDLVLSDIMMPVMDGIGYLNALKADPATSHIPVLLLTAKTNIEDQIRGMEYGADDYITKPFHTALLRAKVAAILRRRETLLAHYLRNEGEVQVQATPATWQPAVPQITEQDNAFITRVVEGIEEHIENPDFKIDILASSMNVSRSVFYRKIKAIVGLSPIDFVKNVRIRRVTELMAAGVSSVTELAYRCGFSSPQYLEPCLQGNHRLHAHRVRQEVAREEIVHESGRLVHGLTNIGGVSLPQTNHPLTAMKRFLLLSLFACLVLTAARAQQYPYQDKSLTAGERAADLVSRLTVREKISLMSDGSSAIKRMGIKRYNWWNEALHGVGRAGVATVLPQPIGMAATFDPDLLLQAYTAVSDEARAKHAQSAAQGSYARYQGLTFWTPTVNILRDPRWGRGIETYGEDPYLASVMGVAVVKGLQGPEGQKYDKLHACAKHFAVHSGPEWNRHSFNAENISVRELYETYLPPFKALVQDAKVKEVMCAYNAFEGDPCCGSDRLLTQILRNQWGFDGIVVSDCGAIDDFYNDRGHHTHADKASAAAAAVISGTDLDCGGTYGALTDALKQGHITEEQIDVSLTRLMKARYQLGEMDDLQDVSWAQIPVSVVASDEHNALALQLARESMTLLTNKSGILPLKRGSGLTVAVIGPNANDSVMQWGNYNGTPRRTITALEGIRCALGKNDRLIYVKGCDRVERTLLESTFSDCQIDGQVGFRATYWNNKKFEGQPAATVHCSTPMQLCTSGATVFAPGVNLTNFTATYESTFTPKKDGEVNLDFYYCGKVTILVDGQEVKSFRTNHGSRAGGHKMKVKAGQAYALQFNFEYSMGDAQLNFDLGFKEDVNIAQAVDEVKQADVIIFIGGIAPSLEGEEMGVNLPGFKRGDRTEIELPDIQREMIQALCQTGKPVVYVNCSGSAIAMVPEVERCAAILQAWYPGQSGGQALAEVLFGDYNPSGRLPLTIYKSLAQLPAFEDYNMAGRTYRYMTDEPLFAFGYGLSYTTYAYGKPQLDRQQIKADDALTNPTATLLTLSVDVTNAGKMDSDEVVQVYLRKVGDNDGPTKTLRAFQRTSIPAGKTVSVSLPLNAQQLEWWDYDTNTMRVTSGKYELLVGSSSRQADLQAVSLTVK